MATVGVTTSLFSFYENKYIMLLFCIDEVGHLATHCYK